MIVDPSTMRLLNALVLRTRRSFFGVRQGVHRSPRRGHGIEFAEYRSYEVGDNPRAIDWNLYARSDKLYIKRYLEEETVSLYILLDGSRSLTHPQLRAKWDLATQIAAFAAYIALASQDPVTIAILGGPHSAPFWGARAFGAVVRFLTDATDTLVQETPEDPEDVDMEAAGRSAAARVSFPGACLVLSDFLYPLPQVADLLNNLQARNMEVHAIQVLGEGDCSFDQGLASADLTDSETGARLGVALDPAARAQYAALLKQHCEELHEHCLTHRMTFTSTTAREPLAVSGIETLSRMGLFV
jgi:uncharacterized protein (DUF58 family)